jgi:hypothetical protein
LNNVGFSDDEVLDYCAEGEEFEGGGVVHCDSWGSDGN